MEFSLIQIILSIAIFWVIMLILASRFDLTKKNIFVGPGIIIWKVNLESFYNRFKKFKLDKIMHYVSIITISLFITLPISLVINLIFVRIRIISPVIINTLPQLSIYYISPIVIPLFFALLAHFITTGIIASYHGVKPKYTGIAFVIFLFTEFIKFDEKYNELPANKKIQIKSAGILTNIILLLIFIPIFYNSGVVLSPLYEPSSGALVQQVFVDSPADIVGMNVGDVIKEINIVQFGFITQKIPINTTLDLIAALRNIKINTIFLVITQDKTFQVSSTSYDDNGIYLGVKTLDYHKPRLSFLSPFFPYWFFLSVGWFINFNILFGIFNLLPIPKSSGYELLNLIFPQLKKYTRDVASWIVFVLLILNIIYSLS